MKRQKNSQLERDGILYLVPTPIGNLEDMTFRGISTLKEVDLIIAEDTRHTRKLCSHFDISTPLDSYHEHSSEEKEEKIIQLLRNGTKIALVSDAGMPLISDPGKDLVKKCVEKDIPVIPLPGANAAITALAGSGLGGGGFYFHGFLSRKKTDRKKKLEQLKTISVPVIFYESPYRIKQTVADVASEWGDRPVVFARELTKKFEEWYRGTLFELQDILQIEEIKGECCLIIEGGTESATGDWWEEFTVQEHVSHHIQQGMKSKDAIKQTAKERNMPKREVYHIYHDLTK